MTSPLFIFQVKRATPDQQWMIEKKIRVKLTGDGTNIGKRLHVVAFGFTILEEGDRAYAAKGNHCIAIFKEPESYESMKLCLKDIINEVQSIDTISVGGHDFHITFYLGGDWKFLAMVTGIDSASSNHACIWCKCPALERYDSAQKWSIDDVRNGARTIEENIENSRRKKYNVSKLPLFPMIPLIRVVVDNLHMFLRVADVLIDLLVFELRRLDSIDKAMKVKNLDGLHYIRKYETEIKRIGISGFSFWIGRESKKLKYRTFTGPEKIILLEKFNVAQLFPEVPNVISVQSLWKDLLTINRLLSVRPEDMSIDYANTFEEKSKLFVNTFVRLFPTKHVTPYMHCMMMHVSQFFKVHGALLPFTQQGMEKYNDTMTKD